MDAHRTHIYICVCMGASIRTKYIKDTKCIIKNRRERERKKKEETVEKNRSVVERGRGSCWLREEKEEGAGRMEV